MWCLFDSFSTQIIMIRQVLCKINDENIDEISIFCDKL